MSGIYIPGMEMPTSCSDCPMLDWDLDYIKCKVTGRHFKVKEEPFGARRVDDCPLVPVPEHGDLIDRDKLEKDIDKYIGGEESQSRFHHWVQVQDAVIPMDKGEEK